MQLCLYSAKKLVICLSLWWVFNYSVYY